MSDRERWIVYPLLFLSLGASLRSKVAPVDQIEAHNIRCDTLLEARSIRCESIVANQLGTESAPINAAWVKNIVSGVIRCNALLDAHRLFDAIDGSRIFRPQ